MLAGCGWVGHLWEGLLGSLWLHYSITILGRDALTWDKAFMLKNLGCGPQQILQTSIGYRRQYGGTVCTIWWYTWIDRLNMNLVYSIYCTLLAHYSFITPKPIHQNLKIAVPTPKVQLQRHCIVAVYTSWRDYQIITVGLLHQHTGIPPTLSYFQNFGF